MCRIACKMHLAVRTHTDDTQYPDATVPMAQGTTQAMATTAGKRLRVSRGPWISKTTPHTPPQGAWR